MLEQLQNYGHLMSAVVIAISTVYTAWVLRRLNRKKGWLTVDAYRILRTRGGPRLYPPRGQTAGIDYYQKQEIHVWIVNTGYRLERVMEIDYHCVLQGWLNGPRRVDEYFVNPDEEPLDKLGVPYLVRAEDRVFQVPFSIEPQHERCWELFIGYWPSSTPNSVGLEDITCVKITTTKGETIHRRLRDARGTSPIRRFWENARCRVGIHR